MKVPKRYEGKYVCAHLGTAVYMASYGAHVKLHGEERLMPQPITTTVQTKDGPKESAAMSNLLIGARVVEVGDDYVEFALLDPGPDGKTGAEVRKLVPNSLIVSLDTVHAVDAEMPTVTPRAQAAPSRIITP